MIPGYPGWFSAPFDRNNWFWSILAGKFSFGQFWPPKTGFGRLWPQNTGFGRFWLKELVVVDFARKNWVLAEKLVLVDFDQKTASGRFRPKKKVDSVDFGWKNWLWSILAEKTGFG